jgi:hypothetical protein
MYTLFSYYAHYFHYCVDFLRSVCYIVSVSITTAFGNRPRHGWRCSPAKTAGFGHKIGRDADFMAAPSYAASYSAKQNSTTGNRQQATGNRQQATGNRQQATGNIIHIF